MSADYERPRAAGTTVDAPPGEVVVSDDGVAVLQHIRRLTHGTDAGASCRIDASVGLDDVPRCRLATMRDLGLTPAEVPPTDRAGLEDFV